MQEDHSRPVLTQPEKLLHFFFVAEKKPERQGRKPENCLTTGSKDPRLAAD
jgi:hypothetical protein